MPERRGLLGSEEGRLRVSLVPALVVPVPPGP